jgi:hypothetical protein
MFKSLFKAWTNKNLAILKNLTDVICNYVFFLINNIPFKISLFLK